MSEPSAGLPDPTLAAGRYAVLSFRDLRLYLVAGFVGLTQIGRLDAAGRADP